MANTHPNTSLDPSFVLVHSSVSANFKDKPGQTCPKCDKIYKTNETLRNHEERCTGRKIMVGFLAGVCDIRLMVNVFRFALTVANSFLRIEKS